MDNRELRKLRDLKFIIAIFPLQAIFLFTPDFLRTAHRKQRDNFQSNESNSKDIADQKTNRKLKSHNSWPINIKIREKIGESEHPSKHLINQIEFLKSKTQNH